MQKSGFVSTQGRINENVWHCTYTWQKIRNEGMRAWNSSFHKLIRRNNGMTLLRPYVGIEHAESCRGHADAFPAGKTGMSIGRSDTELPFILERHQFPLGLACSGILDDH